MCFAVFKDKIKDNETKLLLTKLLLTKLRVLGVLLSTLVSMLMGWALFKNQLKMVSHNKSNFFSIPERKKRKRKKEEKNCLLKNKKIKVDIVVLTEKHDLKNW